MFDSQIQSCEHGGAHYSSTEEERIPLSDVCFLPPAVYVCASVRYVVVLAHPSRSRLPTKKEAVT